jgi:hypothetical protein
MSFPAGKDPSFTATVTCFGTSSDNTLGVLQSNVDSAKTGKERV